MGSGKQLGHPCRAGGVHMWPKIAQLPNTLQLIPNTAPERTFKDHKGEANRAECPAGRRDDKRGVAEI